MNNIDLNKSLNPINTTPLMERYLKKSPIRWMKIGFVMIPHELLFDTSLPRPSLMVYWVLMAHQFQGKNSSTPSLRLLETETRYSKPTIIESIKALEENGWIDVERGHRKVNKYFVKLKRN